MVSKIFTPDTPICLTFYSYEIYKDGMYFKLHLPFLLIFRCRSRSILLATKIASIFRTMSRNSYKNSEAWLKLYSSLILYMTKTVIRQSWTFLSLISLDRIASKSWKFQYDVFNLLRNGWKILNMNEPHVSIPSLKTWSELADRIKVQWNCCSQTLKFNNYMNFKHKMWIFYNLNP